MSKTGLPTLPRLGGIGRKPKLQPLTLPRRLRTEQEVLPIVRPPFNSSWEVWMNDFLLRQNPYWQSQTQFGRLGTAGATRPDFLNDMLKVAFYLDGPVHLFRNLGNKDEYVRASVRSQGYKIVAWNVPTFDYMVKNAQQWYRNNIEGLGVLS